MSIDTLVAERVMGYKWYRHKALTHEVVLALPVAYFEDGNLWEHNLDTRPNDERDSGNAPHFSTDISAAWEVVEEMDNRHFGTHITRVQSLRGDKLFWAVDFNKPNDGESGATIYLAKTGVGWGDGTKRVFQVVQRRVVGVLLECPRSGRKVGHLA